MTRHDFVIRACWALIIVLTILYLTACASKFTGVCLAQGIGQTEEGIVAVAVRCEAS